jgi:hypothetical protein
LAISYSQKREIKHIAATRGLTQRRRIAAFILHPLEMAFPLQHPAHTKASYRALSSVIEAGRDAKREQAPRP